MVRSGLGFDSVRGLLGPLATRKLVARAAGADKVGSDDLIALVRGELNIASAWAAICIRSTRSVSRPSARIRAAGTGERSSSRRARI